MPAAYSFGIRLKARRYLALPALTLVFGLPFLAGWAVGGAITGERLPALEVGPIVVLMTLLIASLAGIKDITDVPGDERVGYRSLWMSIVRSRRRALVVALILMPYVAVASAVALDILPDRFIWLPALAPIGLVLALGCTAVAESRHEQAVRELLYHFWFLLSGAALYLFYPAASTLVALLGAAAYWLVASQFLHWSDGLRSWKVRAAADLFWVAITEGGRA
jgi:4-hydroxybenzoate polyprenyltransferase